MLGESFIHLLKYKNEDTQSPDCIQRASFTPPHNNIHGFYPLSQVKDKAAPVEPVLSDVRHVVKWSGSTTIYPSLEPCNAFNDKCQIYSDLQLKSISESQEFHLNSTKPQEWHVSNVDESSPQQLRSISQQAHVPDDGYLAMDSSIMLNGQPPTNSMINGYLDRKLQEVYSQYLQERLACPGSSPECSLLPLLPQTSLLQLSQQEYLDSGLDSEDRPCRITQYLTTSQRTSSNFSSPVLRISNAEQPKRPDYR